MGDEQAKARKKEAKAAAKAAKASAKTVDLGRRPEGALPEGVSVHLKKNGDQSELTVSGLSDEQLERLLPQVNQEVLITVTEKSSPIKAAAMRFVREGLFQTVIKILAGLAVAYVLMALGLGAG